MASKSKEKPSGLCGSGDRIELDAVEVTDAGHARVIDLNLRAGCSRADRSEDLAGIAPRVLGRRLIQRVRVGVESALRSRS